MVFWPSDTEDKATRVERGQVGTNYGKGNGRQRRQTAKADSHPNLGIPRPSFKSEKIAGDSNETQKWVSRYLAVGETAMDWAVVTAGQSGWFERNR